MNLFGQVTDAATGKSLPQATIAIYNSGGNLVDGTITDLDGYYDINVPAGHYVVVSYTGYEPKRLTQTSGQGWVELAPADNIHDEAVVFGKRPWPLWLKVATVATLVIGIGAIIMYIRNK